MMSLAKLALKSIATSLKTRILSKTVLPENGIFNDFESSYEFIEDFMNRGFEAIEFLSDDNVCLLFYVSNNLKLFKDIFLHATDTINRYKTSPNFLLDDPNYMYSLIFDINWILNDINRS